MKLEYHLLPSLNLELKPYVKHFFKTSTETQSLRRAVYQSKTHPQTTFQSRHLPLSISPSPSLNLKLFISTQILSFCLSNLPHSPSPSPSPSPSHSRSPSHKVCLAQLACSGCGYFFFVNLLLLCIVWFWVLIQVGFDPEINLILGFDQFI